MTDEAPQYVSRAAGKLVAAIDQFRVDPAGLTCADLGCNVGGFTDVLLRRGAKKVYAVDTGYGALAWKLRQDERVIVMERTNALHVEPPEPAALVVVDLGWTKQQRAIPAALRWQPNQIITLIKPHYEAGNPRIKEHEAHALTEKLLKDLPERGVRVIDWMRSPITGAKAANIEYLALIEPA